MLAQSVWPNAVCDFDVTCPVQVVCYTHKSCMLHVLSHAGPCCHDSTKGNPSCIQIHTEHRPATLVGFISAVGQCSMCFLGGIKQSDDLTWANVQAPQGMVTRHAAVQHKMTDGLSTRESSFTGFSLPEDSKISSCTSLHGSCMYNLIVLLAAVTCARARMGCLLPCMLI